jgi:hypothetical protein
MAGVGRPPINSTGKLVLIVGGTAGSALCSTAASGGDVNWWLAIIAAVVAGIVAVASQLPDGGATGPTTPESPETPIRRIIAGIAAGGAAYALYQVSLLLISFGIGSALPMFEVQLSNDEVLAIIAGVTVASVIAMLPINVLLGAAIYPPNFQIWRSAAWSGATLLVFSLIGLLSGAVLGQNQTQLELVQAAGGWIEAIPSFLGLVVVLVLAQLAGASGRDGLNLILRARDGRA